MGVGFLFSGQNNTNQTTMAPNGTDTGEDLYNLYILADTHYVKPKHRYTSVRDQYCVLVKHKYNAWHN